MQVGTAQELCVPTTKTVAKTVYKANFKDPSLLCFQVTRTPFKSPIYDLNQFGTGTLGVQGTRWLCLPSKLAPVVNPPISHFLCYKVGIQVISTPWPKTVTLSNFLQPTPTAFAISPDQLVHCNPAEKMVPKATYVIVNPNWPPALCRCQAEGKGAPSTSAIVANQFGHGTVRIGPAQYLCLPSWKSLTAPPVEPVSAPPGLDHFTCYPVAGTTKGFSFPSPVKVQDEFAAAPVTVRLGRAGALCVPTTKTVNGATTKANFNDPSLLCFAVSKTPIVTPVFDLNQFGNETVNVQLTSRSASRPRPRDERRPGRERRGVLAARTRRPRARRCARRVRPGWRRTHAPSTRAPASDGPSASHVRAGSIGALPGHFGGRLRS